MANETRWMKDFLINGGDPSKINLKTESLGQLLNKYIGRKNISVTALAGIAAVNRSNLYKIMSEAVAATRNTILRLSMALELTFDETQELLKASGNAALTAHSVRDRYISQAIVKRTSIDNLHKELVSLGFNGIY